MNYVIQYSSTIDWKGLLKLPKSDLRKMMDIIEDKLGSSPEIFGKPLRYSFRGHRRIRIGDYRVIFRIDGNTVRVVTIAHRSKVYKK